jgi:hypothetical protein
MIIICDTQYAARLAGDLAPDYFWAQADTAGFWLWAW